MPTPEAGRSPAPREGGAGLAISIEDAGTARVLALRGELDLHTVPELRAHLAAAVADGDSDVVIDLRAVSFIDSSGLAALLNALRRLTRARRRLLLVCGEKGPVMRILRATRLDGTFAMHDTVDAALAARPARLAA